MLLLVLIAAVLFVDLSIKDTIEHTEGDAFPKDVEGTGGMVSLHKVHNPGLPFGRLAESPQLVREIPLAVTSAAAGILMWLMPRKGNRIQKLGLALTIGGAASNLYDRFRRGYVVDYINVRMGKLKQVIFNLGDVCILLGSAIFLLGEVIGAAKKS